MEKIKKDEIITAGKEYLQRHGMSQAAFARHCGVGSSYMSNLLNGVYVYKAGTDKTVDIADRYFISIAAAIGHDIDKTFWRVEKTPQFVTAIAALERAHLNCTGRLGGVKMIIGDIGSGKTTAIDQYCKANPTTTFRITINDYDTIHDILDEIARLLDIELPFKKGARLRKIGTEFRTRALRGERNMLIIDEGENTKLGGIRMYKAIYDMIKGYAAFAIAGTPHLAVMIDRLTLKGINGVPQFKSRMKANMIVLPPIDRTYQNFLYKVNDENLRKILVELCSDYRELNDYLEPALVAADRDGVPLTDNYFRTIYGIKTNDSYGKARRN
jgi:DNA transposition AAA+ family ATPase